MACIDQAGGAASQVYYYHLDHLGTPRELTDTTGKIVWSARYRAYGSLALADVADIDNPLRFQGQYFDAETGLHYNLHRYYDPQAGRFIHQDPIGLAGGVNLFQYAVNPVNWIDPLGLTSIYKDAPYHGKIDNSVKSRAPINGQAALDNSVQVKDTSPRRVGVDVANNEIVVMDRTRILSDGSELFHGHVREWDKLHSEQQAALKKAGKVDRKGKMLDCSK